MRLTAKRFHLWRHVRHVAAACAASVLIGLAPAIAAEALAIPVSGEVSPPLPASGELKTGDRLNLGTDAVVAIIHFRSCEELELQGGVLVVGPSKVRHKQSKLLYRATGDCPGEVDLVETDTKGAVVLMRGSGDDKGAQAIKTSSRPRFLISGDRAAFFSLGVFDDGEQVLRLPLSNGRASWPDGAAALTVGKAYDIALEGSGAKTKGARLIVSDSGSKLIVLTP
ncbi:MAG: hypothetical protein AAF367_00635 [Pseudomonadota bacterium]